MPKRATPPVTSDDSSGSSYLRSKKRVPVRKKVFRGAGPWLVRGLATFVVLAAGVSVAYSVDTYLRNSDDFVFDQPVELLQITGLQVVEKKAVEDVFRNEAGSSIYETLLEQQRRRVEVIPWVKNARVRRIWPNRFWVDVQERRPVAYVRFPSAKNEPSPPPRLVDDEGVLLDPPPGKSFSFPLLTGISAAMPLPDRKKRVALYRALIADLDRSKPYYSSHISEVDVLDPRNAKVATVFDGELVELQMGDENFRHRFEVFLKYFRSWRKELGDVRSVDLRYKGVVATE